jgi:hypothetical protein
MSIVTHFANFQLPLSGSQAVQIPEKPDLDFWPFNFLSRDHKFCEYKSFGKVA